MNARRSSIAAVLTLALAACAPGPRGPAAPGAAGPLREVLPNGVTLIAHEHRASDVVALQLWMRMGGRDEAPAELGLAHFIEHMVFKGTATRPPGSIDRLIEGFGGRSNAFTSQDYTHYDFLVPAEHFRPTLELLADLAANTSFPPAEIAAEKKVVFEEMGLTEDDPDRFLLRRLHEVAYQPHPYGRPILGTRELIGPLDRERLVRFYRKHFVPGNMVLVVVGAVPEATIRAAARQTFGRLSGGQPARRPVPAPAPLDRTRRQDVPRPERQAYLGLAWRTAAVADPDVFAVDLLTYILGDGPSSRLNQVVREQRRLVSAIEAGYGAWQASGLVTVTARLDPANLDRAEAAVLDVIRRVRAEGVTEPERRRALITAEANYAFDIETAEGLAKTYGQAETTWTLADELQYLTRLRRVSAVEVRAAAQRYFGDDNYARVRFVPARTAR